MGALKDQQLLDVLLDHYRKNINMRFITESTISPNLHDKTLVQEIFGQLWCILRYWW